MTTGSNIQSVDYNSIRTKVTSILGVGSATRGYGQPLQSNSVSPGNVITKAQWDALRFDIVNIKVHQDGVIPALVEVPAGSPIQFGAGHPNTNFNSVADQCVNGRFNLGDGQFIITNIGTGTYSSAWKAQAQTEIVLTFSDSDHARHFFNSGGKLRFTSSRSGGATSAQNNAWTNLLSTVGVQQFGGNVPANSNFYTLTNNYADNQFYQLGLSSAYANNFYRLEARCDVADNSSGSASEVRFRVTWKDDYVDPDAVSGFPEGTNPPEDTVDGTLSLTIDEIKASGQLVPSGVFTITSPTYSAISITAT